MTETPVLSEYQEKCRNMYKEGYFDMKYINEGFVDNELDYYKPMLPNSLFENKLRIYLKYMTSNQYQKKGIEQREKDMRSFEGDNKTFFKSRNEIVAHNRRCVSILKDFFNDIDKDDLARLQKLKSKIYEFERIINVMPEYKKPESWEQNGMSNAQYAVFLAVVSSLQLLLGGNL